MKWTSFFVLALAMGMLVGGVSELYARGGGRFGGGFFPPSTQPGNQTRVRKGQLSSAEVERLKAQDVALQKLSDTFTGNAQLTKDELKTLGESTDSASFAIWSKGSDEDGKILSRFGDNIFLVDTLSKLLQAGPITRPQARELIANLRTIIQARLGLSEEDLKPDQRTDYQKKLDTAATKYYTTK